jgi:hypothetical protein
MLRLENALVFGRVPHRSELPLFDPVAFIFAGFIKIMITIFTSPPESTSHRLATRLR